MNYLTLKLRSGHMLYLKVNALLGFYPDAAEGTWLITASPHNIVVEETPEEILRLLESKRLVSDAEDDLLR